jgi:hypothetical protein
MSNRSAARDRVVSVIRELIMLKTQKLLAVLATVLLASAGAANAGTVTETFTGTSMVTYTPIDGGTAAKPTITDYFSSISETLTLNTPTSQTNFLAIGPAGSCNSTCLGYTGSGSGTAEGTVNVTFNFTAPTGDGGELTAAGTYSADYNGHLSCATGSTSPSDCIQWTSIDPMQITFTSLPGYALDITLYNAEDWTIYPKISFELVNYNGTGGATPLPATLPLFVGGLGLMGFIGWGRKRRVLNPA